MKITRAHMILILVALVLFTIAAIGIASAQNQTTFRDGRGQTIGTATHENNGTTTFRNTTGQITGTANRDSNGTTTFRDRGGSISGTATGPRR
jgi:hypothetical protein